MNSSRSRTRIVAANVLWSLRKKMLNCPRGLRIWISSAFKLTAIAKNDVPSASTENLLGK